MREIRRCGASLLALVLGLWVGDGTSWGQAPPAEPAPARALFNQRNLEGWRVPEVSYFDQHGEVSVQEGQIILEAGNPATGIAWKNEPEFPRDHYEVEVEAARLEGSDFFCGLTFPVGKSYCTFIAGGWGGGIIGLSNIDDVAAVENETTGFVEFKQNQFYRIRLRVVPERVQVWIDDKNVVDLRRPDRKFSIWWEQEPVRPFGIATWQTKAAVRKIELRRLPPAENPPVTPPKDRP